METVTSREYKVMLQPKAFAGGRQQRLKAASGFWNDFSARIATTVPDREGDLRTIGDERMIRFYDTRAGLLHEHCYIFRERLSRAEPEREVTLKFRHQDRYFCQDRNMRSAEVDLGRTKFEEDIKPVFQILYSFSTTQQIPGNKRLNKLKDVTLLYPGPTERLDHHEKDEAIEVIRGFNARELVVEGARFQIGKKRKLDSECGLILWYDRDGDDQERLWRNSASGMGTEREISVEMRPAARPRYFRYSKRTSQRGSMRIPRQKPLSSTAERARRYSSNSTCPRLGYQRLQDTGGS